MNNQRRALLSKAIVALETAGEFVSSALDGEQECYDNTPENLEGSDRYERMESAIESLENAISSIDSAKEEIEEASA